MFALIGPVDGLSVLDLFAGSGALGLEALSRGAVRATFVDSDPAAVAAIRRNAEILEDPAVQARIVRADWRTGVDREARRRARYGLCLLDPPYSLLPRISRDLATVLAPILEPRAIIVIEGSTDDAVVELAGLPVARRTDREYGGTRVSVIRIDQST